jgi:hypothetical protein
VFEVTGFTPGATCTATETVPPGYVANQAGCIDVAVDGSCTITNTQRGHLIVTKHTDPGSDTLTQFTMTASGSAPSGADPITGSAVRILTGNNSSTDYEVAGGGTYFVAETVLAGWDKTDEFNCQNVTVAPGTTEYCDITNTQRGHWLSTRSRIQPAIRPNSRSRPMVAFHQRR